MLSCEYWDFFKNTYFEEELQTAANYLSKNTSKCLFKSNFVQLVMLIILSFSKTQKIQSFDLLFKYFFIFIPFN